jgi:hypothetical protein
VVGSPCAVAAVVTESVQPGDEGLAPFGVAAFELSVGSFFGQGAVISMGPIGLGEAVFDATESVSECVRSVAGSVVGQHFPHSGRAFAEPGIGARRMRRLCPYVRRPAVRSRPVGSNR